MSDSTPQHLQRRIPVLRTEPAKRGYLVAVTCWGKPDMIPLILDSWKSNYHPEDASLVFVFDSMEDEELAVYWRHRVLRMPEYHFLPPVVNEGPEWYENGSHAALVALFRDHSLQPSHAIGAEGGALRFRSATALNFHTMIVWQDDQQVRGFRLLDDLDSLRAQYGDSLGLVGGRDGFLPGYGDMASNAHTPSGLSKMILNPGEHARRPILNRGPVIYPRHVVEKVGAIDLLNFPMWHAEADYSARCHKAGFVNVVLGVECEHAIHGRALASRTYQGQEATDAAAFRRIHGDLYPSV